MNFEAVNWCDEAEKALKPLVTEHVWPEFLQQIKDSIATLWRVEDSWLVTRFEKYPNGQVDMVLDVIHGERSREIITELKERAKKVGVYSLVFETHHPEKVAARLMGPCGFEREATRYKAVL